VYRYIPGRGSLMNGTFMQHLGRNQNLGDVRAKLEVQGRWLALVALPVGIGIFRSVSAGGGCTSCIQLTDSLQPFYLSSETVLPIG
jgi:hypothetical protein